MLLGNFQNPHLDAQGNALLATQLRQVIAQSYDVRYPNLKARQFIPVSNEVNPGAAVIEWRSYDSVGAVKLITAYADDLPRSDIRAEQNFSPVRSLGGSYGYNIDEIAAAQFSGTPLDARKAAAVRQAYEQEIDRLAAVGDTKSNLVGLLNLPNATAITIPDGAGGETTWPDKTGAEILADLTLMVTSGPNLTNGIETINTIILPLEQMALISTTPYSDNSDLTILEYFRRTTPGITVDSWFRCKGAGAGGADRAVAYRRDPQVLELHIPKELTALEPEQRNLETIVNHHARFAGVICHYPLAVNYADGI
jgi:hypothetical protein